LARTVKPRPGSALSSNGQIADRFQKVAIDAASGERRIRALEDAHELIATQRDRIARLRERLTASPRIDLARRSAA
jgi:hypothetical protein